MISNIQETNSKNSKANAGAAGIGGGTLLIALASSLPEGSRLRFWLTLVAPCFSVVLSALFLWAQIEIANFMQDRKVKVLVRRTQETLQAALRNEHTSESHRRLIKKKLEELDLLVADRELKRIKEMVPITIANYKKSGLDADELKE